ncbi:hypothetical protein COY91_02370 [Candidatus Shapirobacteria bacterium CG_4_10_14_0_8_um_filter_39_15]|nr:MAG: hypothetical protein COY91_02370 [Candidatus Shapirobacteria bacterium CG_4_10_14_0_8_um_filter_39_15]
MNKNFRSILVGIFFAIGFLFLVTPLFAQQAKTVTVSLSPATGQLTTVTTDINIVANFSEAVTVPANNINICYSFNPSLFEITQIFGTEIGGTINSGQGWVCWWNIVSKSFPAGNSTIGYIKLTSKLATTTSATVSIDSSTTFGISGWTIIQTGGTYSVSNLRKAANGGIYMLTGGVPSDYIAGGSVVLDWRDFEPVEGQYRWELLTNPDFLFASWEAYSGCGANCSVTPTYGPAKILQTVRSMGKTVRFKLRVTEGALPLWIYGGEGAKEGKVNASYGGLCQYTDSPNPHCNPQNDIALAIEYNEGSIEPVWWNPVFLEKYRRVLLALGQKIESDPELSNTVEFVEASVGSYGEMILYGKGDTFSNDTPLQRFYRSAGYTNKLYGDTVQTVLGYYQEAFKVLPIALSLGNGLYSGQYNDGSGVDHVEDYVVPKVMDRWGSKLYLKFAGFGSGGNRRTHTFGTYCPNITRCIYESFGGIRGWQGWSWDNKPNQLESIFRWAVQDRAYIIMMWQGDLKAILSNTATATLEKAFIDIGPELHALGYIEPASPPANCLRGELGNLNCGSDGIIDATDLNILLTSWGAVATPAAGRHTADIAPVTLDQTVDILDLNKLLINWGAGK